MQLAREILDYWFGEAASPRQQISSQSSLWWGKSPFVDEEIKARFGAALDSTRSDDLKAWKAEASDWLALIILVDQFSRNIFRDQARAFEQDPLALSLCKEGIELGVDLELVPLERVFFYLPLEHSESLQDQQRCVELMQELVSIAPPGCRKEFEGFYNYARAHHAVIEEFGRFPHRNAILGRDSTIAEKDYLAQPGAGF